jgi:dihydroxyacetone kinase
MLDLLLDVSDSDRAFVPFSKSTNPTIDNEVILLLNSLGSTSDEVLARFAELATTELKQRGFVVKRITLGPLVTSLKMSGVGITIWRLRAAKPCREKRRCSSGIGPSPTL